MRNHTGLVATGAILAVVIAGTLLNLPLVPVLLVCMILALAAAARSNGPYVWRKLTGVLPILLAVTFFVFFLTSLLPGDPAVNILGPGATAEGIEELHERLHLDDPLMTRYFRWLGDAATGDLGTSPFKNEEVSKSISKALPKSLLLMLYAQLFALAVAIPLGVLTAYKEGTRVDRALSNVAGSFQSMPSYVLAPLLVLVLAIQVRMFPATVPASSYRSLLDEPFTHIRQHVLPVLSIAVTQLAVYSRLLRTDMVATLKEDFINVAKAKGMRNRRILLSHALRPSSFTLLTVLGVNIGFLIGNALIVEQVFSLPGLGTLIATAVFQRDYLVIQGSVVVVAVGYVFANFAVDLLYAVLDPRIRHARAVL